MKPALGRAACGVQGVQGHLEGLRAERRRVLALGGLPFVRRLVEFAEGDVVDGPQQAVRLVAAGLEQYVERDGLVTVQGGDELHVGGRKGLLDHQYACEHQAPFLLRGPSGPLSSVGLPGPAETILPRDRTGTAGFSVPVES